MKIAWFTPFAKFSAIARFSSLVLAELAKHADVEVWHPAADELRETSLPHYRIELLNRVRAEDLASYDAMIYNIGNHLGNHREIFEISKRVPGVCILHDYVMQNFFSSLYLRYSENRRLYTAAMKRYYGEKGELVGLDSVSALNPIWCSTDVGNYPLFEEVVGRCLGVVVHSEFFLKYLEKAYAGPMRKLPLPYGTVGSAAPVSKETLNLPEDRVLAVTIGDVNPNKQSNAVVRALERDPELRRKIFYVIVGSTDSLYSDTLQALVKDLHMEESVRFVGRAPDEVLQGYLTQADICINLRYPSTEGASGSLVEQMTFRKPIIVSDTSFFSELPDSCVLKIRPGNEEDEVPGALRQLMNNPDLRERYAANAFHYAAQHFRADHYAAGLLQLIEEARRAKPLLDVSDAVSYELKRMTVSKEMPIVETAAKLMYETFCSPR